MFRIRRFNVIKTATVVALMYVLIIAVVAVPFLLIVMIAGVSMSGGQVEGAGVGVVGALVGAVALALFYGLLGWVFTAIACVLYNVVAGWVGGIEVQLEAVAPPAPPPAWMAPGSPPPAPPATPPPGPAVAPPSDPTAPPPSTPAP